MIVIEDYKTIIAIKPITKLIPAQDRYRFADFLSTSCLANQQTTPRIGINAEMNTRKVLA